MDRGDLRVLRDDMFVDRCNSKKSYKTVNICFCKVAALHPSMKRKAPPSENRKSKRQRLDQDTTTPYVPRNGSNVNGTLDSPLTDITNAVNGISPRPAAIHTKQLQNKQAMRETNAKRIDLTDDEDNMYTIMEGEGEDDDCDLEDPFADGNEVEIGRGGNRQNVNVNQSPHAVIHEFEVDDPFMIPEEHPLSNQEANEATAPRTVQEEIFETIPGVVHSVLLYIPSFYPICFNVFSNE